MNNILDDIYEFGNPALLISADDIVENRFSSRHVLTLNRVDVDLLVDELVEWCRKNCFQASLVQRGDIAFFLSDIAVGKVVNFWRGVCEHREILQSKMLDGEIAKVIYYAATYYYPSEECQC